MLPVPIGDPSKDFNSYRTVVPGDIRALEIFPPVGIARLGDSEREYFFAPEVPGITKPPPPDGNFRDGEQKIRRQAARFRVYAYDQSGNLLGEVNRKNGYTLEWTVHVANKKGSFTKFRGRFRPATTDRRNPDVDPNVELDQRSKLIVDPGRKTIVWGQNPPNVELKGSFSGSRASATDVSLGELHVDDAGRLVYLGGLGLSKCVANPQKLQPEVISGFDGVDWVDDTSDGSVSVKVTTANNFSKLSGRPAIIICAPPKFVWGVNAPTTLYDIMEDIYHRNQSPEPRVNVEYHTHIRPVLLSTYTLSWTNNQALKGHGVSGKGNFFSPDVEDKLTSPTDHEFKKKVFGRLREPDYRNKNQAISLFMPRISGDDGDKVEPGQIPKNPDAIEKFSALTKLQYDRFKEWKDGRFTVVRPTHPAPVKIEDIDLSRQPHTLTRAHLESTIGDPLYPGIEMWWLAKLRETYDLNPRLEGSGAKVDPPFRVNHQSVLPGHLTRGLSLPWQSDFNMCNTHWWPSVRPDSVVTKADYETVMQGSGTQEQKFAIAATTRKSWDRGFREERTSSNTYPGSTDMVRFWNRLGFVKRDRDVEFRFSLPHPEPPPRPGRDYPPPTFPPPPPPPRPPFILVQRLPVYLESERRKLPDPSS